MLRCGASPSLTPQESMPSPRVQTPCEGCTPTRLSGACHRCSTETRCRWVPSTLPAAPSPPARPQLTPWAVQGLVLPRVCNTKQLQNHPKICQGSTSDITATHYHQALSITPKLIKSWFLKYYEVLQAKGKVNAPLHSHASFVFAVMKISWFFSPF